MSAASTRISVARKPLRTQRRSRAPKKDLESAVTRARKRGYLEYEYKVTLALGAIEFQSGDTDEVAPGLGRSLILLEETG